MPGPTAASISSSHQPGSGTCHRGRPVARSSDRTNAEWIPSPSATITASPLRTGGPATRPRGASQRNAPVVGSNARSVAPGPSCQLATTVVASPRGATVTMPG